MSMFSGSVPNNLLATPVPAQELQFNETDFELKRGNTEQVLLVATSISASTAVSITNFGGRGIIAYMEVTSGMPPGSASVTINLKIQGVSPVGTTRYFTLGTSGAKSASGCYAVAIYPGISSTAVSNMVHNAGVVPRTLRILASISSAAASFGCVIALGAAVLL